MPAAQIFQVSASFEDSHGYLLARIRGTTGALITKASLSAIQLKVYDPEDSENTEIASRDIVINDTVFDTLQTDSGWDTAEDADGFNFKVEVLPTDLPSGSKKYRFEFKFTNTSNKIWHVVVDVPTIGLIRS
jgi:hypothetical protein